VVELSTVLPDLPADVHSVYVGHPRADTRVVHLLLGPQHVTPATEVLCPRPTYHRSCGHAAAACSTTPDGS